MRKRLLLCLLLCLAMTPGLAEDTQVIDTEAWASGTVLLTEEADGRYITVRTEENARRSGPWPKDTIFYGVWREGEIELLWDDRVAWYGLQPDGAWQLTALQDAGENCWIVAAPWGMYEPNGETLIVGNCTPDLFTGPVGDALFDMAASPDRTGLAVVKVESAPLYAGPDGSESLGTFFAGTPAKVLAEQDGWVQLSVAAEPSLTGWMRADQLALGEEIAGVERADIRYSLPESEWDRMPDAPPYHAIGVQGPFVILLTGEGVEYAVYDSLAGEPAAVVEWARTETSLLVLAEDGDARRLWVCETDIQGAETIRQTLPLPGDAALAVDAASEPHGLTLTWNGGAAQAVFDRRPDGEWLLSALVCREEGVSLNTSVAFCGVMTGAGRPVPCAFSGLEESLFRTDLEGLPARAARQDPGSWAVVETFLAEVYADKAAAQAGGAYAFRLWQGTPLQILRVEGALCQVALGDPRCGGLTGWVYTARLAVGDAVAQAALLPDLCVMPGTVITGDLLELPVSPECIWPVGETADGSQAIILLPDGTVGTCPSACIQHGNG